MVPPERTVERHQQTWIMAFRTAAWPWPPEHPRARGVAHPSSNSTHSLGGTLPDRIRIAAIDPRRAEMAIVALHEHLRVSPRHSVSFGQIDGGAHGVGLARIRAGRAVTRPDPPLPLMLDDEILCLRQLRVDTEISRLWHGDSCFCWRATAARSVNFQRGP